MAIVKNFWLKGSKKRLGGAVLYEAMGQTRARELASSVSNPRTEAQMSQRIKWSNLVNFYRANASWMKYAFETKKTNQSEYNKFMSVNVTASQIALTKDMAAAGAVIAYPYILTQGSLPSIEWQNAGETVISNIFINPNDTPNEYDTIGEFSASLLDNNPAFREGDQLSFIRITQMTNNATGYPYVIVRKYEILLERSSGATLADYWPIDLFTSDAAEENNALRVVKENRQGGFCMILSRTIGGKTYVSTQRLIVVNNEALISSYSSAQAIQAAISSYGESTDAFLSSVSANAESQAPVGLSINYANLNGENYTPGSLTPAWESLAARQASVYFNDNLPAGSAITGKVLFLQGSEQNVATPVIDGNVVRFTFPSVAGENESAHLYKITLSVAGTDYEITFASANAYTIQGLE